MAWASRSPASSRATARFIGSGNVVAGNLIGTDRHRQRARLEPRPGRLRQQLRRATRSGRATSSRPTASPASRSSPTARSRTSSRATSSDGGRRPDLLVAGPARCSRPTAPSRGSPCIANAQLNGVVVLGASNNTDRRGQGRRPAARATRSAATSRSACTSPAATSTACIFSVPVDNAVSGNIIQIQRHLTGSCSTTRPITPSGRSPARADSSSRTSSGARRPASAISRRPSTRAPRCR